METVLATYMPINNMLIINNLLIGTVAIPPANGATFPNLEQKAGGNMGE
ncbi:MAG: hypothetical protein NTW29_10820 [Bacteroidetes bacterium]|nr:hypothetical protein [Bacteroidota bacterium]